MSTKKTVLFVTAVERTLESPLLTKLGESCNLETLIAPQVGDLRARLDRSRVDMILLHQSLEARLMLELGGVVGQTLSANARVIEVSSEGITPFAKAVTQGVIDPTQPGGLQLALSFVQAC
jgi:hypothetical protein